MADLPTGPLDDSGSLPSATSAEVSPIDALPVDGIAVARLYGEPLFKLPTDLYIPPDALEVFLEA